MKKVLVAVDSSDTSIRVAKYAANLKKHHGGYYIALISVGFVTSLPGKVWETSQEIDTECQQVAQKALNRAKEIFLQEGVEPDQVISEKGDPAQVIADIAKSDEFSSIIIGSRGLGEIKGYLLGSVSYKVLHLTNCPLTIIK